MKSFDLIRNAEIRAEKDAIGRVLCPACNGNGVINRSFGPHYVDEISCADCKQRGTITLKQFEKMKKFSVK